MKREPGENPGRSGHCEWGAAFTMPLFGTQRLACGMGNRQQGGFWYRMGRRKRKL